MFSCIHDRITHLKGIIVNPINWSRFLVCTLLHRWHHSLLSTHCIIRRVVMLSSNNHGGSFWLGSSKTATLVILASPECYSLFSISDLRVVVPLVVQSFAASMRCYEFRHLVPSWMICGLAVAACLYSAHLTGTEYSSKTKFNSTKPLSGNPLTRMPIDAHWSHSDWFRQSWSCERLMQNALTTCELISRKLISREDTPQVYG